MGRVRRALVVLACASGCGRVWFEPGGTGPDGNPDACAVTIEPAVARTNFNSRRQFTASGGTSPYTFALPATHYASTTTDGAVTTYGQVGTVTLSVSDANNCTATARVDVGGNQLYYAGGAINGVPTAQVWSSPDGATWTNIGVLPGPRMYGGLLVYNDRLWWISGSDGAARTEVFSSADGTVWNTVGTVPAGATNAGYTVHAGRMWMVGGVGNTRVVRWSTNGIDWTAATSLPMDNHGGSLASAQGALWYLGGHNGSLFDWILRSDDNAGSWVELANPLPMGREYSASIVLDDIIWLAGGQNTVPTTYTDVTSTDGVTFETQPAFPIPRAFNSLARIGDRLYAAGGTDGGDVLAFDPGGVWVGVAGNFPVPRQGGGMVAFTPLSL